MAAQQRRQLSLRSELRPGDLGWVIERHGTRYWEEFRWDTSFEALVAKVAAAFAMEHDPARERVWIAEVDGERVDCIFLVRETDEVAKLRLLLVEPQARGLGVGSRLVDECVAFARASGYRTITLWTNDVLVAARRIYARAGFRLVASERQPNFGHDLVSETWELAL